MASAAKAVLVRYDVSKAIGAGAISGYIETDGTIGLLASHNITN